MDRNIKISAYSNLLKYRRGYSAEFVNATIEENHLNGLRIFDHLDPLPSLDFLREYTFLKRLGISCIDDHDYSFLNDLPQLEHLSVGLSVSMDNEIDLSSLVNLRYLSIEWRKDRIKGLDACQELSDLCLVDYTCDDLAPIRKLNNLTRLRIKTGRIKTLEGIEGKDDLSIINLGNCRRLTSISALNGLRHLNHLEIESCRKIADYDMLAYMPALETLRIINCGQVDLSAIQERIPSITNFELRGNSRIKK